MGHVWERGIRWEVRYLLHRTWRVLRARFRTDLDIVCEESEYLGEIDYHDYTDDVYGLPCHFSLMQCKRCGKRFTI